MHCLRAWKEIKALQTLIQYFIFLKFSSAFNFCQKTDLLHWKACRFMYSGCSSPKSFFQKPRVKKKASGCGILHHNFFNQIEFRFWIVTVSILSFERNSLELKNWEHFQMQWKCFPPKIKIANSILVMCFSIWCVLA